MSSKTWSRDPRLPFGRDHPGFRELIDLSVFVDTPLDVALARRLFRDYGTAEDANSDALRDDLQGYLAGARGLFVRHRDRIATCDLIPDGTKRLPELRDEVLERLPRTAAS